MEDLPIRGKVEPWVRVAVRVGRRGEGAPRVVRLPHLRLVVELPELVEAGIDEHLAVAEYDVGRVPAPATHRGRAGPGACVPVVEVCVRLAPEVGAQVAAGREKSAVVNESVTATEQVRRAVERLADDGVGGWVPNVGTGKTVDIVVAGRVLLSRKDKHLPVREQARVDGDNGAAADGVEIRHARPRADDRRVALGARRRGRAGGRRLD